MRHLPAQVLWVAVALGLGLPAAHAAERNTRREALHMADEGAALYKQGRYAEALQTFDRAYNLYPAPALLLNLSRTELKLGQCEAAIRYAQIYAANTTGSSSKSRASWVEHVQSECVEVEVTSTPPAVSIRIDGVPTASPATTPWRGRLLFGKYSLSASAAGYENHAEALDVQEGKALHVALQLTAVAAPPAARVAVNGVPIAPTPKPIQLTPAAPPTTQPPVAAATRAPPRRAHSAIRDVGWAGVAVGGAALVSAVALGIETQNQKALLTSATVRSTAQANMEWSREKSFATATNALSIAGGVLAAAGVVVVIVF
jgi:hypothetical protein